MQPPSRPSISHDLRLRMALDMVRLTLMDVDLRTGGVTFTGHPADVLGELPPDPMTLDDLVARLHPADAPAFRARVRALVATGTPVDVELQVPFPDGSMNWVSWQLQRVDAADGHPTHLLGAARNVTDRRSRLDRLAASQALLRAVIDNLPVSIYTKDPEGRYVVNNVTNLRLLGAASEDETRGRTVFDFFPPAIADAFAADDRRVVRTGHGIYNREEPFVDPTTGRQRWFLTTKVPLVDATGATSGLVGISRDITDVRLRQQALLQSQKVEMIGRLASGVAHDFNNLLTVILGSIELLRTSPQSPGPLDDIELAARHATHLTRQLLTFAREQVSSPRVVNANEVLIEAEQMLRRLISGTIVLQAERADGLWPVRVDQGQLMQVLVNLVVNARDAMPDGGRVTISTANVVVPRDGSGPPDVPPGDYVRIRVHDTGIGLTDEVKARLFEAFFTTKEKGRGTGLGLSTSFGIVRQSGGYITADGAPGLGATFSVYLPRHVDLRETTAPRQVERAERAVEGREGPRA